MKRLNSLPSASVILSVLLISLVVGSCKDEGSLTEPLAPSFQRFEPEASADAQRISDLITALFPGRGLLNSAEKHWRNIQRSWGTGKVRPARSQVAGLVNQSLGFLAAGKLLVPEPNMGMPETTEGALAELVMRLYAYVGLSSPDALDDYPDLFESASGSQDSGFGIIDPETGGVVTSANGWSRVTALPGATGETVFIQMELLDEPTCQGVGELTQALGCWSFDRYPAGDFLMDVAVETCVADPGEEVMTDYEYYAALRLHNQDEITLEITALPLVNSELDCSRFPLGEEPGQSASADPGRSFLSSLGSSLADLLLPDPLAADFRALRRPPRGVGGLGGSFTRVFPAVPDEPEYERLPIGEGPTAGWSVEEPAEGADLCNEESGVGCPPGSVTAMDISAVAVGSVVDATPPWWRVFFFYRPADQSEAPTFMGRGDLAGVEVNGFQRFYTWTITLEGGGLPEGLIDVYAVGVRPPGDGGAIFGTRMVTYITVVSPLSCATQTEVPATECEALEALYNSTGGDEWTDNSSWLDYSDVCGWHGVTCEGGAVTSIDLHMNELTGSLPAELGNLNNLRILWLGQNQLTGSIPPEFGNLSNLRDLFLQYNELTGPIPAELGRLGNLERLYLYTNQLNGPIPGEFGNLGNLQELTIRSTQISGSIPPELGNLSSLKSLTLDRNQLSGPIPPELGNLRGLEHLYLPFNQLIGPIPPELGNLGSLDFLHLGENQLSGSIPPELGNLSSLTRLSLAENQLTGAIPPELGDLGNMELFYLSNNQLSGVVPLPVAALGGSPSLSSGCHFLPGNDGLYIPDTQAYRDADQNGDGLICGLGFTAGSGEVAWSEQTSGTTFGLLEVWASSPTDVYAVGNGGVILRSDGSTWTAQTAPGLTNDFEFRSLSGIPGMSHDVIAGGCGDFGSAVWHFDGSIWVSLGGLPAYNGCVRGLSEGYFGLIVGNGMDLKGRIWVTSGTNDIGYGWGGVSGTAFQGAWGTSKWGEGFAVGNLGLIVHNHNDGNGWVVDQASGSGPSRSGVWGSSDQDVFVAGETGQILHYDGSNWTSQASGTGVDLFEVWGSSGSDVYAVGRGGTVLHYDGIAWSALDVGVTTDLFGLWVSPDGNTVYIVGDGGVILKGEK